MTEETTAGREPGWYRDPAPANPAAPDSVRYWDGRSWTAQTRVASKRERREWMAEAAAAGRAYEQQLFERAQAGDVEAQLQLQAAAAATSRWTTPDGAVLAGWWVRVAAHLLDGVAVMILGTLFAWRFLKQIAEVYSQFVDDVVRAAQAGSPQPDATTLASATAGPILWVGITFLLVGFVYEVGFLKGYSASRSGSGSGPARCPGAPCSFDGVARTAWACCSSSPSSAVSSTRSTFCSTTSGRCGTRTGRPSTTSCRGPTSYDVADAAVKSLGVVYDVRVIRRCLVRR
jgi:hypothetical protein